MAAEAGEPAKAPPQQPRAHLGIQGRQASVMHNHEHLNKLASLLAPRGPGGRPPFGAPAPAAAAAALGSPAPESPASSEPPSPQPQSAPRRGPPPLPSTAAAAAAAAAVAEEKDEGDQEPQLEHASRAKMAGRSRRRPAAKPKFEGVAAEPAPPPPVVTPPPAAAAAAAATSSSSASEADRKRQDKEREKQEREARAAREKQEKEEAARAAKEKKEKERQEREARAAKEKEEKQRAKAAQEQRERDEREARAAAKAAESPAARAAAAERAAREAAAARAAEEDAKDLAEDPPIADVTDPWVTRVAAAEEAALRGEAQRLLQSKREVEAAVAELRASLVALQARAAAMGVDAHAEDATQQQQQQQQQQQLVAQSPQTPSSSKRLLSMPRSSSFTRASVIAPRVVTVEEAMRDVAGRVFKAGWVEKEGFNVRSWRRRFFVLYADRIDYYEDVRQSPKGSIQLETCAISGLKTHAGTSRPCLELTMEKRKWHFVSDSPRENAAWLSAISNRILTLSFRVLADPAQPSTPLTWLHLSAVPLTELECGLLADSLRQNTTVQDLALTANGLRGVALSTLLRALAARPAGSSLRSLRLDENVVGDAGASELAQLVCELRVEELSLRRCGITAAAVAALSDALLAAGRSPVLRRLALDNNELGDAAAAPLAALVRDYKLPLSISAAETGLGAAAAATLASALVAPRSRLRGLWLKGNALGGDGTARLVRAAQRTSGLCALSAGDVDIGADELAALRALSRFVR